MIIIKKINKNHFISYQHILDNIYAATDGICDRRISADNIAHLISWSGSMTDGVR